MRYFEIMKYLDKKYCEHDLDKVCVTELQNYFFYGRLFTLVNCVKYPNGNFRIITRGRNDI